MQIFMKMYIIWPVSNALNLKKEVISFFIMSSKWLPYSEGNNVAKFLGS